MRHIYIIMLYRPNLVSQLIHCFMCNACYTGIILGIGSANERRRYIPWQQGSWGHHGAHPGPIGPRWAPWTCYLGTDAPSHWLSNDPWCRLLHHVALLWNLNLIRYENVQSQVSFGKYPMHHVFWDHEFIWVNLKRKVITPKPTGLKSQRRHSMIYRYLISNWAISIPQWFVLVLFKFISVIHCTHLISVSMKIMVPIFNEFCWMKFMVFRFKFHRSLFLTVQLTVGPHCFRYGFDAEQGAVSI